MAYRADDGRWQRLFDDLEGELEATEAEESLAAVADRTRYEFSAIRLVDRLRGSLNQRLVVRLVGASPIAGVLGAVGHDWLLLEDDWGAELLVLLHGVVSITGLGRWAVAEDAVGPLDSRITIGLLLRRLARDRRVVGVQLRDGTQLTGTPQRVGADAVDLLEHDPGEVPRPTAVRSVVTIPWQAITLVRSR